ncbi:MAG: hypothetical protein A3H94_03585 [Acidobacteria bacterium RIFCSPLOWO2_02_FULL_60_20]|nr:MAG: hypothetical protein A3H94_03585 [Acidobacteria bacterium RIFCSPLOWO2_02_FULL_60_20]
MNQLFPQSGIGIEFRNGNFHGVYCKSFWKNFREIDRMEIRDYQRLGPRECGRLYREFLRRQGLKSPWTVVALARSQVLLRALRFPRGMEQELARAVEYQLDALHPFEEGSVAWSHAIWALSDGAKAGASGGNGGRTQSSETQVLVAIAQKQYIEELADWFREAEIPVSQFSVTTTLLLGYLEAGIAAQLRTGKPYFLLHATEQGMELLGCAAEKGLVSREIPLTAEAPPEADEIVALIGKELDSAHSEMRLVSDDRPRVHCCGEGWLPESAAESAHLPFHAVPVVAGASLNREDIAGVAAAYAASHRRGPLSLNLLPAERRSFQPRLAYAPTYALSGLLVVLAMAMGLRGSVQDWIYSRYLERERQALLPGIQELEKLHSANQDTLAHLASLEAFRRSGGLPLDLLDELTRTLPADAWLQQLQYEGNTVTMSGTATSASAVLQAVSSSIYLEAAQFSSALNRTPEGKEVFRIGARLRAQIP